VSVGSWLSFLVCCLGTGFKTTANRSVIGDNSRQWSSSSSTTG